MTILLGGLCGAAAGFVVVLVCLRRVMYPLGSHIADLENRVRRLEMASLPTVRRATNAGPPGKEAWNRGTALG